VRFARGRTLALAGGLMVAAVGFSLLTASVDVNTARIQGVVGSHWRGAYDILVLPAGGSGSAPTSGNAVQANYLSAAARGISLAQDREIASLPGVSVAAPLEIVGYVLETVSVRVSLTTVVDGSGAEVFTLTSSFTSDNGLSRYPSEIDSYVYVTPDPVTGLQIDQQRQVVGPVEHLPNGESIIVCPQSLGNSLPQPSPFESAPGVLNGSCVSRSDGKPIEGAVTWSFPVLIANARGRSTCLPLSVSRGVSTTSRPSSPAASSSAWPSREPWSAILASCSPTSRPETSTASWAPRSWTCSSASMPSTGSPCSSPPTTTPSPPDVSASSSWATGGSSAISRAGQAETGRLRPSRGGRCLVSQPRGGTG
jgi:hypothetical protein